MGFNFQFTVQQLIDQGRITQNSINDIKNIILTSNIPTLPDELIALFLLSCNNNLKNTEITIKAYFRIKHDAPEMFNERDIDREELKRAIATIAYISVPVRMQNNTVIHFFKVVDGNYQNFDLIPIMKIAYMLIDISQRYDPPNNLVVVIDMKGVGLMHLTRLKLGAIKTFLEFLQEAMPLKIKTIHILNANYIFDKIMAIVRVFMKNELMSILKIHAPGVNMQDFYKEHIPARCLPRDYGGELASVEELNRNTIQQFRELKPYFEYEENIRKLYKPCNK